MGSEYTDSHLPYRNPLLLSPFVMARGNGGDAVFVNDDDRKAFLHRLGQACDSHGWKVHAWVLMGNHFHLLLETPQPNLVSGMKRLLSAYSQGWNRARMRRGHVFQGRYKAVPVNATDSDPYYFKALADYIHLNPARAGLAGGKHGPLLNYPWSSLRSHHKGKGPDWLESGRILREGSRMMSLPMNASGLAELRKSDPRKVRLAILLRTHTTVSNAWIAERLAMGHPGSVSRSVSEGRARKELRKSIKEAERMLIRVL